MADIRLDRGAPAAELVLDRPDKRNAVTAAMWRAIPELLAEAEADACKVLVVRGAGGAFAAGADIGEFEEVYATRDTAAAYSEAVAAALDGLAAFPKPTIAKISGACVGGGCGIALACDLRFADAGSRFGITPGKLGLVYTLNDTKRLVDAVGVAAAKDILFTGRLLDAEEALRLRLIDRLAAPGELDDTVDAYVAQIAAASQHSARATKKIVRLIQSGVDHDTEETKRMFLEAFQGADFQEGYTAFLAKRTPEFPEG